MLYLTAESVDILANNHSRNCSSVLSSLSFATVALPAAQAGAATAVDDGAPLEGVGAAADNAVGGIGGASSAAHPFVRRVR